MFGNLLLLLGRGGPPPPPTLYYPAAAWLFFGAGSRTSPVAPTLNPFEVDLLAYLQSSGMTVYAGHVPQGVNPPAYTFLCVSEDPRYTIAKAAGLTFRSYQFSSFSTDYLETVAMDGALWAALGGFRGNMGSTFVSSCRLVNTIDLPYEANVDGSDEGTYHRAAEYRIGLKKPIPTF